MNRFLTVFLAVIVCCSCGKTAYFVVRHAEKATAEPGMSSDVPLTDTGTARAEKLKTILLNRHISYIFSTQTNRTISTARPLSEAIQVPVQLYNHRDTLDRFITRLKSIEKKNVLIVGHSNSVDDIVNKLMGVQLLNDLPETEYHNLFIVIRKGKKYVFNKQTY